MQRSVRRLIVLTAALLSISMAASADDFLTSGASARAVATGGAYLPSSDNVLDAMAINPAGLALLSAPVFDLSLKAVFARGQFTNSANPDGRLSSNGAVPYGAFGGPVGSGPASRRFSVGFAALPELLGYAKWRYNDAPGPGGVSYGLQNNNSEILAMRAAVGVGVYLNSRVQLGASLGAVYNSNTLQTAYVFQNYAPLAGLKTLLDLHTDGIGWNGSVGALVRASKRLRFGVAYKTGTTVRSTGAAAGNAGIQFAAIGLGAARPDFRYNAEVDNVLPRAASANVVWQFDSRTRLTGQADWIGWKDAFVRLPVILTNGTNSDINGLLGTNAIADSIPLQWRDQIVGRFGVERSWLENAVFRAGYAHSNSPVPDSTLSPLTAAIARHTVSAGIGYRRGRWRLDVAYAIDPWAAQSVQQSALLAGEYANSRVRLGTQSAVATFSIR